MAVSQKNANGFPRSVPDSATRGQSRTHFLYQCSVFYDKSLEILRCQFGGDYDQNYVGNK